MKRNKAEQSVDITGRLRQIEMMEMPKAASPCRPDDDHFPPLHDVERHEGRMYVAGHEPHLRPVTLLHQVRSPRHVGLDPT